MSKTIFDFSTQQKAKKLPQYIAALTACLGSLAAGAVYGWTANISEDIKQFSYNHIPVDDDVLGWIGSLAIFGAAFACIPTGYFCNLVGRKKAMMYLTIPFTVGWLLIIFAKYLWMIYLGRFLTGMACGAFGVAAPIYISENVEKDIRGALACYFDLMMTIGILIATGFAMILDIKPFTITMGILPLVFAVTFIFQPESYVYYAQENKGVKARKALIRLRGKFYDVDEELETTRLLTMQKKQNNTSFLESIKTKAAKKAAFISCMMMVFQQTAGIEAIVLYTSTIFESTGVDMDPKLSTLIFAALQASATFLSTLAVDRLGRRYLLISSSLGSGIALGILAVFFTFESRNIVDESILLNFKLVPLLSLSIYIITYAFGMGPIPWFLAAELFPTEINGIGCSFAAVISSFTAFLVSKFYFPMQCTVGSDVTFYFYSGMTLMCVPFVYYFVPETRNKTLAEIERELNT